MIAGRAITTYTNLQFWVGIGFAAVVETCCPLSRLGSIDVRPSYHSRTQLWPVGYQASWQDAAVGTFHCDILEGGEEGPLFAVSLVPPQADQAAQVCHNMQDASAAMPVLVYTGFAEYACLRGSVSVSMTMHASCHVRKRLTCLECVSVRSC